MDSTLQTDIDELQHALERVVPALLPLPGSRNRALRAQQAIERIARAVPIADLPRFEELVRGRWREHPPSGWKRLSSLDRLAPPPGVELLGLASFHPNGLLREAAVARLAGVSDGRAVRYLLLRANDWVAAVRARAVAALRERVQAGLSGPFLEALPLAARLERLGRSDHRELSQAVLALVVAREHPADLGAGLSGCNRSTRREALRVLLRVPAAPWVELQARLGADTDPIVRLRIVDGLASSPLAPGTERALVAMATDGHPGVRERALRALLDLARPAALALLERALWDPAGSMRLLARFHLERERPGLDLAESYRRGVAERSGRERTAAIAGLAETGAGAQDLDLLRGLALGPCSSAVVRAALGAAWRLDCERARPLLLEALGDRRPGVVRTAAALLRRAVDRVEAEVLRRLAARPGGARLPLLPLVLELEPWDRIALWPAFAEPDEELATRVSGFAAREPLPSKAGPYGLPPLPPGTADELGRRVAAATWLSGPARSALEALLEEHRTDG